jgi:hypothetical protein
MKAQFDLKIFLGSKREEIIAQFGKLQNELFYDGTDLRTFGIRLYNAYVRNNVKSEQRAQKEFLNYLGMAHMECVLKGGDQHDAEVAYAKKFPHLNK